MLLHPINFGWLFNHFLDPPLVFDYGCSEQCIIICSKISSELFINHMGWIVGSYRHQTQSANTHKWPRRVVAFNEWSHLKTPLHPEKRRRKKNREREIVEKAAWDITVVASRASSCQTVDFLSCSPGPGWSGSRRRADAVLWQQSRDGQPGTVREIRIISLFFSLPFMCSVMFPISATVSRGVRAPQPTK